MNQSTPNSSLALEKTLEIPKVFYASVKIGIYRELQKKGLLTTKQLDALIALQKDAGVCLTENRV